MARRTITDDFRFEGFESPNTTPVPDVVFDRLLARLGEAELKALLYIIRRTFGFKKDRDPISFNQFLKGIVTQDGKVLDEGCGVRDRTTLSKALQSLEAKGIVTSEKGTDSRGENTTTVYRLRFRDALMESPEGVVGNSYHRSMNLPPPVVGKSYPQETARQQTDIDLSNTRKTSQEKFAKDDLGKSMAIPQRDGSDVRETTEEHGGENRGRRKPEMPVLGELIAERREKRPTLHQPRTQPDRKDLRSEHEETPNRARIIRPRHVPHQDEVYQVIQAYISDFSRELNDRAPLRSSTTRAYNLYKRSGLDQDAFIAQLYAARSIVKERTANIRSLGDNTALGVPTKHKAAYYFAVLEDLLGFREPSGTDSPEGSGRKSGSR